MKQEWKICKLGEVGTVITGGTPSMKEETFYSSNDYCFFKPGDIAEGEISILKTAESFVSAKAYDKSRKLPKGSVLTTCIGIIGKVGITEVDSICNQQINAIIPNEKSFSRYIAYAIISQKDKMKNKANAAVVPILNKSQFSEISIPLPPLSVQQQIVSELDLLTSIINKKKAQLEELDKLAQATFYDMFGDPVENEKGWEVKKLGEVCTKIGSGATPIGGNQSYKSEGIALIRSLNVYNSYFKYEDLAHIDEQQADKLSNVIVQENDVLLNITGASVARCYIVPNDVIPARVNQHVAIVRCYNGMNHEYLHSLLVSDSYQQLLLEISKSNGATREALTKSQLEGLPIILPPLPLQQQFAQKIELIESQKSKIKASLAELETLLAATMDKYFG